MRRRAFLALLVGAVVAPFAGRVQAPKWLAQWTTAYVVSPGRPDRTFYVSPLAGVGGDGTLARPFRTIAQAMSHTRPGEVVRPGDTIMVSPA